VWSADKSRKIAARGVNKGRGGERGNGEKKIERFKIHTRKTHPFARQ